MPLSTPHAPLHTHSAQKPSRSAVTATGLWRAYGTGEAQVVALRDVSVSFASGQFTAIMGP